jgi:hypothetical protein
MTGFADHFDSEDLKEFLKKDVFDNVHASEVLSLKKLKNYPGAFQGSEQESLSSS